jgi:hypothetical protein
MNKDMFETMFTNNKDNPFTDLLNKYSTSYKPVDTPIQTVKPDYLKYINEIKNLEIQVIFLANACATLSKEVFKQNSDYWIDRAKTRGKEREGKNLD